MKGLICGREALEHLPLIWREFGAGCALRCLTAVVTFRKTTFLSMIDRPNAGTSEPAEQVIELPNY